MESEAARDTRTTLRDDSSWDSLIQYIADGSIIPVVGRELLTITDSAGNQRALYAILAERLAAALRFSVTVPENDPNPLGYVAAQFLLGSGGQRTLYSTLSRVLEDAQPIPVPTALVKLARIEKLRRFITATFDPLLTQALEGALGMRPDVITYTPNFQPPATRISDPVILHLLGRATSIPNYVVTDEDAFEFMYTMLAKHQNWLADYLGNKMLLIVGCSFPSWLVRFLLRVARPQRFFATVDRTDFVVDSTANENAELVQFLQNFKAQTELFVQQPSAFVDELDTRWRRYLRTAPQTPAQAMQRCAVFLSYASEDAAAAQTIAEQIEQMGTPVWLDKRELAAGDEWERKIVRNIEGASIFVPLLSRACLEQRGPRYFPVEWRHAVRFSQRFLGEPFIAPLILDDVPADADVVPAEIRAQQWSRRAADGTLPREFLSLLSESFKRCQLRARG